MTKKDFRIEKFEDDNYYLIDNNSDYKEVCTLWYEKKSDATHVKLPKDNPSGRTYIRQAIVDEKGAYDFDKKTTFRTGLAGGGWRSKMTEAEATELAEAEATIERIKKEAGARETVKIDPNSVEGIEAAIAKLRAKLAATQG